MFKTSKEVWFATVLLGLAFSHGGCGDDSHMQVDPGCALTEFTPPQWVACKLQAMTLEEKVGQLFMTHVYGQTAADMDPAWVAANRKDHGVDTAEQLVERYHLGGVIYYNWAGNLQNPTQIAGLSSSLQTVSMREGAQLPLLITADQEYGAVVRVNEPATQFPGNMALAATYVPKDAHDVGVVAGQELQSLGINQDFAPDADVNSNPQNPVIGVRSFGLDPTRVGTLVQLDVKGLHAGGTAATAKHFPGHGDTDVDSHFGLPLISRTRAEIEAVELVPFKAAISAHVDAIMSAHIVVPALDDSGLPATLSHPILTDLLRGELGFQGVIVSDALDMQGAMPYGADSAMRVPVEALKAGVDLLLKPPSIDVAYHAVLSAVQSGAVPLDRLDEAVGRILALKQQRKLLFNPFADPAALLQVGTQQHLALAESITERGITLVKNDAQVLPLQPTVQNVLVTGWGQTATASLAAALSGPELTAQALQTGATPTQAQIDQSVAAARAADLCVVLVEHSWQSPQQQALVSALQGTGRPVVIVSVREPYDLPYFSNVDTYVATYGYLPVSMRALAKVLLGKVNPSGQLPVAIPQAGQPATILYPIGHGLRYKL